jgi:imidazolonepropionase-like amidohydrolase
MVAPQYVADLLLVDGDPLQNVRILEDPAKLTMIMQGGTFHKPPAPSPAWRSIA